MEFCEVASMGMEYLSVPYLNGGDSFYDSRDAARAVARKLETALLFWPYMAVMDAFQLWAYENPDEGAEAEAADAKWAELWTRFMPGVDWSGLEDVLVTGWHRKPHIFTAPLYYVEYGIALVGALQVYRNSLRDHEVATRAYRRALALGGTVPLPELFETAGARFAFDAAALREIVELIEAQREKLEV
jgi:oligoendopeptidase F